MSKRAEGNDCIKARRCRLVPFKPKREDGAEPEPGVDGCCPAQTADHVIPKASFPGQAGWSGYDPDKALCMCAEGPSNHTGTHGLRHSEHKAAGIAAGLGNGDKVPFEAEMDRSVKSSNKVAKSSGCSEACLKAQLRENHKKMARGGETKDIMHKSCGKDLSEAEMKARAKELGMPSSR